MIDYQVIELGWEPQTFNTLEEARNYIAELLDNENCLDPNTFRIYKREQIE